MDTPEHHLFTPEVANEIQKRLDQLEIDRKKAVIKIRKNWVIVIICTVIICLIATFFGNENGTLIIIGIGAIIGYFLSKKYKKGLRNDFKENILSHSIQKAKKDINYTFNAFISQEEFERSKIFSGDRIDRYYGEDLFTGMKGKTAYRFSELHAEEKHTSTDSDGNRRTYYETIFKGLFMIADFNKKLKTTTRVIQMRENFLQRLFTSRTTVKLENPIFEKRFNTYSEDQVEARYILTPDMMEKMLKLQKAFNADTHFCFKGNHVYIAIETSYNHFEANISNGEVKIDQVNRIFKEIEHCLKIIDILDLNTRIWTKK